MEQQLQSAGQTQNAPEKKKWYKKWWVITIAVIIVLGAIGSSGEDKASKPVAQEQDQKAPQVTDTKQAEKATVPVQKVSVTSANLTKEYSDNEVAADAKYKGKLIEVSGKVTSIDNGLTDNEIIVRLSDGQYDFSGPMCYTNESEHEKVLALKKGQQVTLIGTGDSATLKSPVLKDCVIK